MEMVGTSTQQEYETEKVKVDFTRQEGRSGRRLISKSCHEPDAVILEEDPLVFVGNHECDGDGVFENFQISSDSEED
jgi:hypothetical protein